VVGEGVCIGQSNVVQNLSSNQKKVQAKCIKLACIVAFRKIHKIWHSNPQLELLRSMCLSFGITDRNNHRINEYRAITAMKAEVKGRRMSTVQ